MDLEEARALVAATISKGLEYSSYSRLDSPRELFDQLFAEVDRRAAEGLDVLAWWQVVRQYRPSSFGNEIGVAVTTFAAADLPALVGALDLVKQSRLQYELSYFALLHAPRARYVQWLELTHTPRLLGLGVACALRALVESHTTDADAEKAIEDWASSLRRKQLEVRSSIWWQLAALAPMTGPMRGWSAMADALWKTASREIEVGEHCADAYAPLVARLRPQCGMLNGLFARLAVRGGAELRAEAAAVIRQDFVARLQADEWSLPSLENAPERVEYLPAIGWAIAHEVQTASKHARWWEAELSQHLVPVPRWRSRSGWRKRCGLILLSACCAAHHLLEVAASEAESFCETLLRLADTELPALMGSGLGTFHPARFVLLALVNVECRVSPASDGSRVMQLARLVQSSAGLEELVKAVEGSRRKEEQPPRWLADLTRLKDERAQYEAELYPERQAEGSER